ncbi:MAG: SH3 domain-containing protein [Eubacteriales bacterium]|nr:SH3 domain-containing protein [Eubacteriales bacterium]
MLYSVKFQTVDSYKNIKYGQGTVYSSGCGPASLCNCLKALGIADVSVSDMCAYAVKVGARVTGGTDEAVLLKHAADEYGFTWKSTSKNAELLAHLKEGGVAIMNQGSTYQVFSNGGHFVAAVAASGETITVLDSYWNDSKYLTWPAHHAKRTGQKGVVTATLTQCGKATIDRAPSYYLISKKPKTVTTTASVNARAGAGVTKKKLGTINKGAKLVKLSETDNWMKSYVWFFRKYCTIKGNTAKLKARLNARASNSIESKKLGVLSKGTTLAVLDKTENWVKVAIWVAKKYIK